MAASWWASVWMFLALVLCWSGSGQTAIGAFWTSCGGVNTGTSKGALLPCGLRASSPEKGEPRMDGNPSGFVVTT